MDLILNGTNTSRPLVQTILGNWVDQLVDKEHSIYLNVSAALNEVIVQNKIQDSETANALVYRLMELLKDIGPLEKGLHVVNTERTIQIFILGLLPDLIKLVKIEDPKNLNGLVIDLIETSKNTIKSGRTLIVQTLLTLHETDNEGFDAKTLEIEMVFLKEIVNSPNTTNSNIRREAFRIFEAIYHDPSCKKVLGFEGIACGPYQDASMSRWQWGPLPK